MTTTDHLFHDASVGGGWTEVTTLTRRICTALWKATDAFARIENYQSDVVLDYESLLDAVTKLDPECSFSFVYSVGRNGTHLAINTPGSSLIKYEAHVKALLEDDRGGNSAKFIGSVVRSGYLTDKVTGSQYGADKYALTIDNVTL